MYKYVRECTIMDATEEDMAPAVRSILTTARSRSGGDTPITVTANSLQQAFDAAESAGRIPVIAEVKPTSPTTSSHRDDDPVAIAKDMVAGGAAAVSVLTEPDHFSGSTETLRRIRSSIDVPVLRKDFILRENHLDAVPADIVLLIARFIDDLPDLHAAARDRGFQVLVEVHTAEELTTAIDAGADIIGINNRDLAKLDVDLGTFERLAPDVPDDITLIAESGITTQEDVERMRAAGADGLLIGTAIMDGDVRETTRRLTRL